MYLSKISLICTLWYDLLNDLREVSWLNFDDVRMYVFIMYYIMCLIIFGEKAEIKDQYPLSLNQDQDRLQKYWANIVLYGIRLQYLAFSYGYRSKWFLVLILEIGRCFLL